MKQLFRPPSAHPGPAASQFEVDVPAQDQDPQQVDYIRWLSQMQTDLAQTLGGMLLRGTRPVKVGVTTAGQPVGTLQPAGSAGRFVGWSLRETTGANPATVRFYDGRGVEASGGTLVASVQVPAGLTSNITLPGNGASFLEGLFVDTSLIGTAAIEGTVYLGAAD